VGIGGLDRVGLGGGLGRDCRAGAGLCPETVDEAGEHQGQRVFACALSSGEDDGLRDALV
jgi:hypothetical protein